MDYKPKPILPDGPIPEVIEAHMEWIAEQIHERWAAGKMQEGWTYGCHYNEEGRKHPNLLPYDRLSEGERDYDRNTAAQTIQMLLYLGFQIIPPSDDK